MILTHLLVLVASPTLLALPAASRLPVASSEPIVSGGQLDVALVPALPVRAAPPVLAIRER